MCEINNYSCQINSTGTGGVRTATDTVFDFNRYMSPRLVETIVNNDSIELVYEEDPAMATWPQTTSKRVFKVVYSCIDGKWHQSERIYGHIVPACEESYEFDV